MAEEAEMNNGMFGTPDFVEKKDLKYGDHQWMNKEDHDDHINIDDDDDVITSSKSSSSSSMGEYSRTSTCSSSSDMADDAPSSSSTSNSSSSTVNGPLFQLSELMAQLPIKRGLSKYFQGKSQSFTSLSSVNTIEELAKKETPFYRKKMKLRKSHGKGFESHKLYTLPRATIAKKLWRNSGFSSSFPGRIRSSFLNGRPPLIPIQKKFRFVL